MIYICCQAYTRLPPVSGCWLSDYTEACLSVGAPSPGRLSMSEKAGAQTRCDSRPGLRRSGGSTQHHREPTVGPNRQISPRCSPANAEPANPAYFTKVLMKSMSSGLSPPPPVAPEIIEAKRQTSMEGPTRNTEPASSATGCCYE